MSEQPSEDSGPTETHTSGGASDAWIGPYKILERIGEGGMGEVWLAEQSRPLRRRVAVKVIKPGLDTAQVVARFDAERQALALMDHPCIAKVFDAGSTLQGRPYFAMEYVRGESLTAHCDRHQLSIDDRLEVFLHLCDGVQHAHQKGIIHRDLKPSNVLVTNTDERPVPKIIDFGIAKAISQPLTDHTLHTSLGGFVGTLEYMSPEQAEMGGVDVDTRTDVYALGVILYELLTGVLPLDRQRLAASSLDDARRTIRELDPPRPSTRVTASASNAEAAATRRGTDRTRLASLLRGDLDAIALKALEKDRSRRYATVGDLAADIRRHLAHEPVQASPPSARYRLSKFVRRNRLAVGAVAVLTLFLAAFAIAMALQARRIAAERDRANREAATAKRVSEFLVGLFKVSDPNEARGNTLTAREVLDSGVANIEKDLTGEPVVQARLMGTMGAIYTNLGLYDRAEHLLTRAVDSDRRLLGNDDPTTLTAMNDLANAYWYQDKLDKAEPLYVQVVDSRKRVLGDEHPDTLLATNDLASLYILQKRFDEAERLVKGTLAIQERVRGPEHGDLQMSLNILQSVYYRQGRYRDAEPLSARALAISRATLGDEHPETLTNVHNLAAIHAKLGRLDEAERLYLSAISTQMRVIGATHQRTINSQSNLALLYEAQQRWKDAEAQLLPALSALTANRDSASPLARRIAAQLATLYDKWQQPAKAAEIRAEYPK